MKLFISAFIGSFVGTFLYSTFIKPHIFKQHNEEETFEKYMRERCMRCENKD